MIIIFASFLEGTVDEEPSSVTGRKDSLSINLEFVKVSLSRMRRSGGPTFTESLISAKGGKMDTTLINISGTLSAPGEGVCRLDLLWITPTVLFVRVRFSVLLVCLERCLSVRGNFQRK